MEVGLRTGLAYRPILMATSACAISYMSLSRASDRLIGSSLYTMTDSIDFVVLLQMPTWFATQTLLWQLTRQY